jgi:hypothetical protein
MAFGPDLLMSAKLSASCNPKIGMAWHPGQEPAQLCSSSITHQTHMEDIQGSGGS